MSHDRNTNISLTSSTPDVGRLPHKVRLQLNSPLAGFNQLLPHGIPTAQAAPNLLIGEWECYEAILPDTLNTCDLTIALFQPDTPANLCKLWLSLGIVALPCEWVEVMA